MKITVCEQVRFVQVFTVISPYVIKSIQFHPVTAGLRPGYELGTTERGGNRGGMAETTYDWSWRSWVIARGRLVAARSTVMFKTQARRFQITGGRRRVVYGRTTSRATVVAIYDWSWPHRSHDWSCDWSHDVTTVCATSCDRSRPVA